MPTPLTDREVKMYARLVAHGAMSAAKSLDESEDDTTRILLRAVRMIEAACTVHGERITADTERWLSDQINGRRSES